METSPTVSAAPHCDATAYASDSSCRGGMHAATAECRHLLTDTRCLPACLLACGFAAVKFKLSKIPGSDDLLKGLHRLLFNRDGTVRHTNPGGGETGHIHSPTAHSSTAHRPTAHMSACRHACEWWHPSPPHTQQLPCSAHAHTGGARSRAVCQQPAGAPTYCCLRRTFTYHQC